MKAKTNLTEILTQGTPRQKALLVIKHEEEKHRLGGVTTLTEKNIRAIINSLKKCSEEERAEFNRCVEIAEIYSMCRLHLYSLQENLFKFSARICNYLYLWEQAEKETELFNTLLSQLRDKMKEGDYKKIEAFIYRQLEQWNRYIPINRVEGRVEVEVDTSIIRTAMEREIEGYTIALSIAKAYVIASERFQRKEKAIDCIPDDIKTMLRIFKQPNTTVPELYRREAYLKLLRAKGENDREVKFRAKYAILPAYEEVKPVQDNNLNELFKL